MGDLSPNLSRHEMACRCGCGFNTVDTELVEVLQALCDHVWDTEGYKPILIITGPNRCFTHNIREGGEQDSQHPKARAADFQIKMNGEYLEPKKIYDHLNEKYPKKFGIGLYHNRIHLDTRSNGPARWEV